MKLSVLSTGSYLLTPDGGNSSKKSVFPNRDFRGYVKRVQEEVGNWRVPHFFNLIFIVFLLAF
jgi:hypothetical protein